MPKQGTVMAYSPGKLHRMMIERARENAAWKARNGPVSIRRMSPAELRAYKEKKPYRPPEPLPAIPPQPSREKAVTALADEIASRE
jgi:hypothetical protein